MRAGEHIGVVHQLAFYGVYIFYCQPAGIGEGVMLMASGSGLIAARGGDVAM